MDRKTMYTSLGVLVVILIAVVIYFSFFSGSRYLVSYIGKPVPQSLVSQLNVSPSVSARIVAGAVSTMPILVHGSPLTNDSKPQVLYIGAEYCPYCAVTRWGMIIALSRFGTFSNLHYMISNTSDIFPGTPTFTFLNSSYSSPYITFTAVETESQTEQRLQTPTASQGAIFEKYNYPPYVAPAYQGGIPFIDFGNYSIQSGAPVLPSVLVGYNWTQIAGNLTVTNSSFSQALVGSADVFTAQICRITNFTPTNVCSQPYVNTILSRYG